MYKQNKLGIYVYPNAIYSINDIGFDVNSISIDHGDHSKQTFRVIKDFYYGIFLNKIYHNNVH